MSVIDSIKENKELECLQKAIALSKGKNNDTERILSQLSGEIVYRKKNDRPDIIVKCNTHKGSDEFYIGIEHFLVNQASSVQGKKVVSKGKENYSHLQRILVVGKSSLDSGDDVSERVKSDFVHAISEYANSVVNSDYESLLKVFQTILNNHYCKVDSYRENIQALANGAKVKLAFLIEIESFLNHLFTFEDNEFHESRTSLLPITDDILNVLRPISRAKVDYIVLLFRNILYPEIADVIAIRPEHIQKQLNSQGLKIYKYFGSGITTDTHVTNQVKTDDGYRFFFNHTINGGNDISCFCKPLKEAVESIQYGVPIALDRTIAVMLYSFGTDIKFQKLASGNYEPIFTRNPQEYLYRFDRFTKLFPCCNKNK